MRKTVSKTAWTASAGALALLAVVFGGTAGTARDQPNIVVIIVDTLRADKLGAYGNPLGLSPELDALASGGVRFDHAVAQSTWTRPSIASMLTALHPRTLGIYQEPRDGLGDGFVTLAESLGDAGYRTIGVTANPNINSYYNFDQGFDRYVDSDVVFRFMPVPDDGASVVEVPPAGSADVFETVFEALEADPSDGPTYVQVNLMEVHEWHDGRMDYGPFEHAFPRRPYARAVRKVSYEIDRFLDRLFAMPDFRDTVVVVTSDHGESLSNHAELASPKWHGFLVYESQARVPLVFFDTFGRVRPGLVVDRPVRLLDVMPTLLDLAGAEPPEGIQGVSLAELLSDPDADVAVPDHAVVETSFRGVNKIAVYSRDWKYVENRDRHPGCRPVELHRVGEMENGWRTDLAPRHPDDARALRSWLSSWEDGFPKAAPVRVAEEPSERQLDQLRSIGYLQ